MKLSLQSQICFMSRFRRIKPGFAVAHPIGHKLHNPFTLMTANTKQTDLISFSGFSHILKVAKPRYLTQIAKAIVEFVAVYVVNVLYRPFARHVGPRKTMRELFTVMDGYSPIPRRMFRPSYFAYEIGTPAIHLPREDTSAGVINETRPQMVYSAWFADCHDNPFNIRGAA